MPTSKKRIVQAAIVRAFGERLRELRVARGMTQRDLADRARVTLSYVSKLEAGGAAPGLDLLQRLAEATGVEIPDFLPRREKATVPDRRKAVQQRFEMVVSQAGEETLAMLDALLFRFVDPQALRR